MDSDEFSPSAYITRLMNYWWLVALVTILGGTFGFIFYHLRPPLYEATAIYIVTLDLDRFPIKDVPQDMLQYNEDLALNTTQAILLSPQVMDGVISQGKNLGVPLSHAELLNNYTIERKQDVWELRYRNEDPAFAQAVVNIWAEAGYQAMVSWQKTGKAPNYVIFQPPAKALEPQQPVLYNRNRVMLAGATIGFIIGILVTNVPSRLRKSHLGE